MYSMFSLPDKDINNNEVITVDEDPGYVADEKDHDNAHENERKVDFPFNIISSSLMYKPKKIIATS